MAKSGITLKLEGFEELLKDIEVAGKNATSAVESCMKQSAQTMDSALRNELRNATESGLADKMPKPNVETEGNTVRAYVGFKMDSYNPANPSDAYKAVFLNYGTPHRKKHGKEQARGFIKKAKSKANKTIKKQQEETLKKILERLKR